jgi:DtxR family Mn-dependent transcriptional regulator
VLDEDAERLRYLAELGIRPGAVLRILDKAPFEGPLTLWVDGASRAVGIGLAAQVFVEGAGAGAR